MSPPFNLGAPLPVRNVPSFDPSILPWRGWWRAGASYNTSTGQWAGEASATDPGYDGSTTSPQDLLDYSLGGGGGMTKPTAGPSLNGFSTLSFDGVHDRLAANTAFGVSGFLAGSAPATTAMDEYTIAILFNLQSATSNNANVWNNHMIIGDASTFIGLYARNGGTVDFMQWDGADKHVTKTISLNTWVFAYMTYNNSVISLDVGGGASTVSAGQCSNAANGLRIGQALSNPLFNGYVAEVLLSNRYQNATRAQLKSYFNARYGLSLS